MKIKIIGFRNMLMGTISFLFGGCYASINPLPQLLCTPKPCVLVLKQGVTAETNLKLTQFGESKDGRTFSVSVSPQISGLSVNLTPETLRFEEAVTLTVTSSNNIAIGNYQFTIQAVADSTKYIGALLVSVEP